MVSFTNRMGIGFPGRVTRDIHENSIEPGMYHTDAIPQRYGGFVKLVNGRVRDFASNDAASVIYGMLVAPYPTQSTANALNAAGAPTTGTVDVLRRGYIAAPLRAGGAVKGGTVFVVNAPGQPGAESGEIVTSANPANTGGATAVAVPGATFMGPADANGIVEIAYNI